MSDDLAQAILCLTFTAPAVGLLVFALARKSIGGTDFDNSVPILEDEDPEREPVRRAALPRRIMAVSIGLCLFLVAALTIVTLLMVGGSAVSGKCPMGF